MACQIGFGQGYSSGTLFQPLLGLPTPSMAVEHSRSRRFCAAGVDDMFYETGVGETAERTSWWSNTSWRQATLGYFFSHRFRPILSRCRWWTSFCILPFSSCWLEDIDLATISICVAVKNALQSGDVEDAIAEINRLNPTIWCFGFLTMNAYM